MSCLPMSRRFWSHLSYVPRNMRNAIEFGRFAGKFQIAAFSGGKETENVRQIRTPAVAFDASAQSIRLCTRKDCSRLVDPYTEAPPDDSRNSQLRRA